MLGSQLALYLGVSNLGCPSVATILLLFCARRNFAPARTIGGKPVLPTHLLCILA